MRRDEAPKFYVNRTVVGLAYNLGIVDMFRAVRNIRSGLARSGRDVFGWMDRLCNRSEDGARSSLEDGRKKFLPERVLGVDWYNVCIIDLSHEEIECQNPETPVVLNSSDAHRLKHA